MKESLARSLKGMVWPLLVLGMLAAGLVFANQREVMLVKDINTNGDVDAHGGGLTYFTVISDTLFFIASDSSGDAELWKSDGTEIGTVRVKDIRPGIDSLIPGDLVNFNNTLFFRGNDGSTGEELWTSDGTEAGTVIFKDINATGSGASSFPYRFRVVDNLLFFVADDGVNGVELWRSDGTSDGTVMVKDINSTGSSNPVRLVGVDNLLFFVAFDGVNGEELWKSDGTAAGTVIVKDINPGGSSDIRDPVNLDGTLFFTADDGVNGRALWKSDGTEAGTVLVADIDEPNNLTVVDHILFLTAGDSTYGIELWKSDGTIGGTLMVKDIRPGMTSSLPTNLTNVEGILYFTAVDGTNGRELWRSDGTETGTVMVLDIFPGDTGSVPVGLRGVDGRLFFRANDGTNGVELWKSDGAAWNTFMVDDINSSGSSTPESITALGNGLIFIADNGAVGRELQFVDLTNQSPTSDAGGPYNTSEGAAITLFGIATDADGDDMLNSWSASSGICNFSDTTILAPNLTCADNGVFTVTLTVTDSWNAVSKDLALVTVSNVSPTVNSLVSPGIATINTTVLITATYSDGGSLDTHTFEIDWGDSTVDSDVAMGGIVTGSHSYALVNTYVMTVTVSDDDGGSGIATATIEVVANQAPVASAGGPYSGSEGTAVALNGSASDPDNDPLLVNWLINTSLCSFSDSSVLQPDLMCSDNGVFTATLTVTDTGDLSSSSLAQVSIANEDPTIDSLEVPGTPVMSQTPVSITATYSDPGSSDTHTYVIDWGDGDISAGAATAGSVVESHIYTVGGQYPITITVTDDDGGEDTAAAVIMVEDAIAGLTAVNDSPTILGQPTIFTATITAGTNVTYAWDFGDGASGSGPVASHTYATAGPYTATVTAANSVSSAAADTGVIVEQAISGLSAVNDSPTALGQPTTFTATITVGSNVTYTWDFGDGAAGSGPVASHTYAAAGPYTATVTAANPVSSAAAETPVMVEQPDSPVYLPVVLLEAGATAAPIAAGPAAVPLLLGGLFLGGLILRRRR
jgi:ELWxxDGT repeat protein